MLRVSSVLPILVMLATSLIPAGEKKADDKSDKKTDAFVSGPQPGTILPGPFDVFNINGGRAKGRYHCLVCEYGLNPVVLVFTKEPAEGKDAALKDLLKKLDEAVDNHAASYLASFVVFLSPDGRSSATEDKIEDTDKLVEEATRRQALITRLKALAYEDPGTEEKPRYKNVVLSFSPMEGPKRYELNPRAEATILFYEKHKVLANFSFEDGKFTADQVDPVLKVVDGALSAKRRKAKK